MITREFLSALNFRVMDESDKMGFAGVQSPVPLIAELDDNFIIIIDGNYCEVIDVTSLVSENFGELENEIVDTCENISELPY